MTSTNTSTIRPTSINYYGVDMYPDYMQLVNRWTHEVECEFAIAGGIAFPYDDEGVMYDFGVMFTDGRSDKAAVCRLCNIDKADAYIRWTN